MRMRWLLAVGGLCLGVACAAPVRANVILNGDFESPTNANSATNTFPNWTEFAGGAGNAGDTAVVAAVGITGTSARLVTDKGNLVQAPAVGLSSYQLDLDFAMPDPVTAGNRGFSMFIQGSTGQGQINMRVVNGTLAGKGTLQAFRSSDSTWQTLVANAVNFSASDLSSLTTNHLTITGSYGPVSYTAVVNGSPSAASNFTQGTTPTSFSQLTFSSDFSSVDWVVDNVVLTGTAVPEPGVAGLIAAAALMGLGRRRGKF